MGLSAACGGDGDTAPDPSAWVTTILAHDGVFAGAPGLRHRWELQRTLPGVVEVDDGEAVMAAQVDRLVPRAVELVHAHVDESLGRDVAAFLDSDAGAAVASAERVLLASFPFDFDAFEEVVTKTFTDEQRVGEAAKRRFLEVQQAVADGERSTSPMQLAVLVAAMTLEQRHAAVVRAFYASDVGARWLAARRSAFPGAQGAYREVLEAMNVGGPTLFSELPPFLPK